MKYLSTFTVLLLALGLSAQTFEWNDKGAAPGPQSPTAQLADYDRAYNERQVGQANVYAPEANGTQTSFGEIYRPTEVTAGHAILPMGTLLRVVNQANQQVVVVRVNDRLRDCQDCLVTLSETAARTINLGYGGQVSVERTGFSNWNPAPPRAAVSTQPVSNGNTPIYASTTPVGQPAPATYNYPTPTTAGQPGPSTYSYPAPAPQRAEPGVVRPVQIEGRPYDWTAKGGAAPAQTAPPVIDGRVVPRTRPVIVTTGNVPTVVRPAPAGSVLDREVTRAPAAYGTPAQPTAPAPTTYQAPTSAPTTYQAPSPTPYQAARGGYGSYDDGFQQTPVQPVQQAPIRQAAPPAPTVPYYQRGQTVPVPATYQTPRNVDYDNVPATTPVAQAAAVATETPTGAAIQLGAYTNEMYARNRVNELKAMGIENVFYVQAVKPGGQLINRVYSGTYANVAAAQAASNNLRTTYNLAGIVTVL